MTSKPVEEKNYYELLGVEPKASKKEIRLAYRELARIYHPDSKFYSEIVDTPPTDRDVEVFKIVTAAYSVLMDAEKRSLYDIELQAKAAQEQAATQQEVPFYKPPPNLDEDSESNVRPSEFFAGVQPSADAGPQFSARMNRPQWKTQFGKAKAPSNFDDGEIPSSFDIISSRKGAFDYALMFAGVGLPLISLLIAFYFMVLR